MFTRTPLQVLAGAMLATPLPALADDGNITFYGIANVSYDFVDTGTSVVGTQGTTVRRVSSNASRFGLKGSEDLGEGLKANWQIESAIALDNAGGTFATRNSYAALSHREYGSVLLGRHDTPYKTSTRKLDNFCDSIGDNRSLMGGVTGVSASKAFDARQPDVIAYSTPIIAGFSAVLAHVNLAETASTAAAAKASLTSVAGMYDSGSLYASLAYELHQLDTVRIGGKEKAWKLGLGYRTQEFSVGAAYEKTSDTLGGAATPTACAALGAGADCLGHHTVYLTGKYMFGSNALKAAYTVASSLGGRTNTGANQVSLGYDRHLTRRTTLFVAYTRLTNENAASYGLGNSAFSSAATASIGAGADPSALSLGMKQVF